MMLQSIGAVLVGFIGMAAAVMIGSALAGLALRGKLDPSGQPPPGYLAFDFALGMAAAAAGGLIVTRLAPSAPLLHAIALGCLVLAMAVVCLFAYGDNGPPRWYQALLSLSSTAVVAAVAWLA